MQEYCKNPFATAIIVAAGSSSRMGGISKQLLLIGGKTVLCRCLETFGRVSEIREVVLVVRKEEAQRVQQEIALAGIPQPVKIAFGGATRQQSVSHGVALADQRAEYVAIHDGARPFVEAEDISRVIGDAVEYGAAALAVPVKDTIKQTDPKGFVVQTPDRNSLWSVQTPQVFQKEVYFQALKTARQTGAEYTDDCQLVEQVGIPVHLLRGSYRNIKITTMEDINSAEGFLQTQKEALSMRIGHGYDVHRLTEGRPLIIGGVRIPYEKGLLGHSDADVLAHAVSDALLGAAGLGDIGLLFPDQDSRYLNADSMELLRQVVRHLDGHGFQPSNIDATVVAQRPKLRPFVQEMRNHLAVICGLPVEAVSVKATTEEKLGFTGREEGIAAHAVCLIKTRG